jgi:sarcosine oxidase subunit alpha
VVFTTNDSAYAVAGDMLDRGIEVAAVVDAREAPAAAAGLRDRGVAIHAGAGVVSSTGGERLESVRVAALDRLGDADDLSCDLLAVSGGWTPTLHLYAQAGGRLRYEPLLAAHVPDGEHPLVGVAGAAAGTGTLDACIAEGADAGRAAAGASGSGTAAAPPSPDGRALGPTAAALWAVPPAAGAGWERHFVDLQRDATVADIRRAIGAGLRSLEHVKRYTTVGTGADQGKTSNVNAMGIVAELLGEDVASLAPTTYRPPYAPVPFAVLAGRERGDLHDPIRTTSIHPWHVERGAAFEDVGQWKRPWYYPAPGEDMDTAVRRECAAARGGVAVMDASTLGKIDVQGPDAAEFLDRVYTNLMSSLAVGACRYGVLCKVDGMVFDDGVVMRLAEDRFVTTTTTGGAAAVMDFLEEWLQTEWPELRVRLTSVTDHWATVAVVGPRSRDVIARLAPGVDAGAEGLPFMAIREATVAGAPARLCRVSFSGELAFEIHVPARFGSAVWTAVMDAGEEHGITPYGTEAMHVLRAEKGYVIVGQETDGTVTPQDAGMSWIVSRKKDFFIGRRSHRRPDMLREDRRQLVGLLPEDPSLRLPEGAQLIVDGPDRTRTAGHVTSSYDSGTLGRTFALALLEGGHGRMGETVRVAFGGRVAAATVTETVFYDPEGRRRDGDPAEPA